MQQGVVGGDRRAHDLRLVDDQIAQITVGTNCVHSQVVDSASVKAKGSSGCRAAQDCIF